MAPRLPRITVQPQVPLEPAALVTSPELWSTTYFPSSAVGVMLNGLPHYPALDASGLTVWDSCESSLCNTHVGSLLHSTLESRSKARVIVVGQ